MDSIPLFKFLDPHGAKLTLGTGTFKHAKPSDFNDTEDLTISSAFPRNLQDFLLAIQRNFISVVTQNLDCEPTCSSPMREQLLLIQESLKTNPNPVEILLQGFIETQEDIFDLEYQKKFMALFISDINNFMQGFRVLCVTTDVRSRRMWCEYAKEHTGVALRIKPNINKDSKFNLFQKVHYRENRPCLFSNPKQFLSDSLYGDREEVLKRCVDKIIYTKTWKWKHESEYRLVIPVLGNESPWDMLAYHAEEITELYMGTKMLTSDRVEIMDLAKKRNPNIVIYLETPNEPDLLKTNLI